MNTLLSSTLALILLTLSGILAIPFPSPHASSDPPAPAPYPGTQPGCGPAGCHNPTGTFGLIRQPHEYQHLCHPHHGHHDPRPRACFDTQFQLEHYLSAPNPQRLSGYIDGSDTKLVLFAGQIVTLDEKYEIHVEEIEGKGWRGGKGCARVKIYRQPWWVLEVDERWCPGHNRPIAL